MDTETLERLLMDRALGGLTPDAAELMTAYLAHDAAAAARAREFDAAAAAARAVLRPGGGAALPSFPALRLRKLEEARRRLRIVRNIAGLAAAIVLGLGIGAGLWRGGGVSPVQTRPQAVVVPESRVIAVAGGFWSTERLIEQARHAKRAGAPRLIWNSAVSEPRPGGES